MGWIAAFEVLSCKFSVLRLVFVSVSIATDRRHQITPALTSSASAAPCLFLREQLLQKLLHGVVGHDARIGIRLALSNKKPGWGCGFARQFFSARGAFL